MENSINGRFADEGGGADKSCVVAFVQTAGTLSFEHLGMKTIRVDEGVHRSTSALCAST